MEINIPTGKVAGAIASLSSCHGILYAEPNYEVSIADTIPNDPDWGNQYGLLAIHAPQGWDLNTGSSAVTIAIVDTGVDLDHVDLAGKIVPGFDFVNNNNHPQDDDAQSHGTHVAGIAAAETNNGIGIAGVSWGAQIMPVKVLNSGGFGTYENVAAGIVWAADHGAEVINLSLGGSMPSSVLKDAVNYAYAKGVTLVAAAGNSGSNSVLYPARYPHVIAVAATDSTNNRASFSNYGPEIDVAAPGVDIYSTNLGDNYGYLSGTSMAAPFVSGLVAILRGIPGNVSPDQITQEIEISALDLGTPGKDDYYGYGLIQMDAALQVHVPPPTPTTSRQMAAAVLPATGFSPDRITILPEQSAVKDYTVFSTGMKTDLGDLWLEIPRLGVEIPIVGVPLFDNGWDVSWLGDQAGWLNGTAFPTHAGNSVLAAHVYDASGQPGPFVHLGSLVWGDQIIVHAFGQEYVYAVREAELLAPGAVAAAIKHEQLPWLTLITCQGYEEASNTYRYRVVVSAVQVAIK
ncbi:MAG: S8 family serine peptidase [Anaerolineales bacterium]